MNIFIITHTHTHGTKFKITYFQEYLKLLTVLVVKTV